MSTIGSEAILMVFLLFCRIGGCLMLMPGFSSSRVPVQVRVFLTFAVTLALAPVLLPAMSTALPDLSPPRLLSLIVSETMVGAMIGLIGRVFYVALQFMATAVAQFAGFNAVPGMAVDEAEPIPPLASFITLTATVLLFITDQHWEVLRALAASYSVLPVTEPIGVQFSLAKLADGFSSTFLLALQISAPFIVYALIINLMVGIANKLTPQIPVYFISLPFVLAGGLLLLYFTIGEALRMFMSGFIVWLATG